MKDLFKQALTWNILGWVLFLFFGIELFNVPSTAANLLGVVLVLGLTHSTIQTIKHKLN
jgi:hypothetical protein